MVVPSGWLVPESVADHVTLSVTVPAVNSVEPACLASADHLVAAVTPQGTVALNVPVAPPAWVSDPLIEFELAPVHV